MLASGPVDELPDSDGVASLRPLTLLSWIGSNEGSSQCVLMMALRPSRMSSPNRETPVELSIWAFTLSVSALRNPSTCIPPWVVGLSFA